MFLRRVMLILNESCQIDYPFFAQSLHTFAHFLRSLSGSGFSEFYDFQDAQPAQPDGYIYYCQHR
jgi:hypothetical protein